MNNDIKFYVVVSEPIDNTSTFERMLKLITSDEVNVNKVDNVYEVEGVQDRGFSKLVNCIQPLKNDLKVDFLSIVVVPCFKKQFLSLLDVNQTKVFYLFDLVFEKAKEDKGKLKELKSIFNNVSENLLTTVKNYINMNQSIIRTSEMMFTHRNTVNYRINKFISLTRINIREINSAMLVYLLLQLFKI